MNKNVKKIVTLCLYGIALSASTAMGCQKGNLQLILNTEKQSPIPSPENINEIFGSINFALEKQNSNNQTNTESIQFNQINNDKKEVATILANFSDPELNKKNYSSKKRKIENEEVYSPEKNKNIPKTETGYIKLEFSDIDTPENYADVACELPQGKQTLVIISCCFADCNSTRSGALTVARRNMGIHREQQHGIKYHTKRALNRNIPKIEIEFSSINTQEQYNDVAHSLSDNGDVKNGRQKFVRICCPNCHTAREGKLYRARAGIKYHIKKEHPDLYCE